MAGSVFESYALHGGYQRVEGWVAPGALTALSLLMDAQEQLRVAGDIGEIGVHHGRYFIALAALSRPGERLVALDLFDDQHLNVDQSGKGDRERFLANMAEHGPQDAAGRLSVVKADSTAMRPDELRAQAGEAGFRFFSVDGGHTVRHVMNDLALAEAALADGGIISLDDFFNLHWPGIAEGLVRYALSAETSLVPLFYGDNKLYLSKGDWARRYTALLERRLAETAATVKATELLGHPVRHITFRPPEGASLFRRAAKVTVWDAAAGAEGQVLSARFSGSWAQPHHGGRWTLGSGGAVTLALPEIPPGEEAKLLLHLYPFTARAAERELEVTTGSGTGRPLRLLRAPAVVALAARPDAAGTVTLTFRHGSVGSPRASGEGEDDRDLGVLITRVELDREG